MDAAQPDVNLKQQAPPTPIPGQRSGNLVKGTRWNLTNMQKKGEGFVPDVEYFITTRKLTILNDCHFGLQGERLSPVGALGGLATSMPIL